MMHRKLYDPSATRKLWRGPMVENGRTVDNDDWLDLFGLVDDGDEDMRDDARLTDWEDFVDDDTDKFDDILAAEEDESLAVEQETDEMLFGPGVGGARIYEDLEEELLRDGDDSDGMLF